MINLDTIGRVAASSRVQLPVLSTESFAVHRPEGEPGAAIRNRETGQSMVLLLHAARRSFEIITLAVRDIVSGSLRGDVEVRLVWCSVPERRWADFCLFNPDKPLACSPCKHGPFVAPVLGMCVFVQRENWEVVSLLVFRRRSTDSSTLERC